MFFLKMEMYLDSSLNAYSTPKLITKNIKKEKIQMKRKES
jgi:hypothetical protein